MLLQAFLRRTMTLLPRQEGEPFVDKNESVEKDRKKKLKRATCVPSVKLNDQRNTRVLRFVGGHFGKIEKNSKTKKTRGKNIL